MGEGLYNRIIRKKLYRLGKEKIENNEIGYISRDFDITRSYVWMLIGSALSELWMEKGKRLKDNFYG